MHELELAPPATAPRADRSRFTIVAAARPVDRGVRLVDEARQALATASDSAALSRLVVHALLHHASTCRRR